MLVFWESDMRSHLWLPYCIACFCLLVTIAVYGEEKAEDRTAKNQQIFLRTKNSIDNDRITGYLNIEGFEIPMALDTGAGITFTLFQPVAEKLGLQLEENEGTQEFYKTKVRVGIGNTGEILSDPVNMNVLATPIIDEHYGIIGWPVIRRSIIDINLPETRWEYRDKLPEQVEQDWVSFPLIENRFGVLLFLVNDQGEELTVCLDTGTTGGVHLDKEEWSQWCKKVSPEWVTIDAGYSPATKGGFAVTKNAIADEFKIGELKLKSVNVEETFAEVLMNGNDIPIEKIIIGMNAIKNRRVLIDGPGGRIYFGPIVETKEKEVRINRAQATWIPDSNDQRRMIASVIKDGVAYQAGLRDGDNVLMVNGGIAANGLKDKSVRPSTVFKDPQGTRVRLLVERDGERFPITFELGRSPLDPEQEADR
jgi:hypothetical protein